MKPATKATAIVASILIVMFCLIYAMATSAGKELHVGGGNAVDMTKTETLSPGDGVSIESSLCSVNVTTDAEATALTAHLYGSSFGISIGSDPELEVTRSGGKVTVSVGRNLTWHIGWSSNLKLDVVLPANFRGDFNCQSSAGAVTIGCDMNVGTFRAHSSAGSVRVQNVTAEGSAEISSSAGGVEAGSVKAKSLDMHTSAGRVRIASCTADTITLHSSGGSVEADDVSGTIEDASSSAGSVTVTLRDIAGNADIHSSAGSVHVTLPAGANAKLDASTSAGSVNVNGLTLSNMEQKRSQVKGTLGSGGFEIKIHSSAGGVDVNGK